MPTYALVLIWLLILLTIGMFIVAIIGMSRPGLKL
uniref:Uncharacterized protein n=1 Tax=viral metagenome TaxID=1070528 RepID=A0A6C0CKH1_9ZZZZ